MKLAQFFKSSTIPLKDNYRPINTLSNFTRLFESIVFTQLNRHTQNKFSKYFMGF